MYSRFAFGLTCLWLLSGSVALADPMIVETFTDYPDNALISASPAGPAHGLTGDWYLDTESHFYVNRTESDLDDGTGKAVYDFAFDDNGSRKAYRLTSSEHVLFNEDGDVFFASFLIQPPRATGNMLFTLMLDRLDGGGQSEVSFGMKDGHFIASNGSVVFEVSGGTPAVTEMLVVLKVEYLNNGNEAVTLWVDPADEFSDPEIDNMPVNLLNEGGGKISAVAIQGAQMAGQPAFFDNLRVGLQFEDVAHDTQSTVLSQDTGVNGLFYDANNPGHGFDFNVHEFGFTAYYFGHTSTGERLWLISELLTADLEFGVPYALDMFEVTEGVFGYPVTPTTHWGTITINLTDCDSGHASFNGLDGQLEMDLVRLAGLPDLPEIDCQY